MKNIDELIALGFSERPALVNGLRCFKRAHGEEIIIVIATGAWTYDRPKTVLDPKLPIRPGQCEKFKGQGLDSLLAEVK